MQWYHIINIYLKDKSCPSITDYCTQFAFKCLGTILSLTVHSQALFGNVIILCHFKCIFHLVRYSIIILFIQNILTNFLITSYLYYLLQSVSFPTPSGGRNRFSWKLLRKIPAVISTIYIRVFALKKKTQRKRKKAKRRELEERGFFDSWDIHCRYSY